ncbi:MAG: PilZ domain-containing protein [Kofleriaceae bacterium]|nr:PilZ domain-containing protein [Kofleriaceae bacterium]MBP6837664.1 PilZ domain-containing protein [Kofleriaceae bacterium]
MRVTLRLSSQADWLKVFDPRDGMLVVAGTTAAVGTELRVDLMVSDAGPRVVLRGHVVRPHGDGVMVALGQHEREKINYLNGFVRGGLLDLREKRRLPVRLAVTYGGTAGAVTTHTRDINEQGVFVLSDQPLPETAQVHLFITLPGRAAPLSLTGTVSHTVLPDDEDLPGMGIVFLIEPDKRDEMRALIDQLEADMIAGRLPDSAYE